MPVLPHRIRRQRWQVKARSAAEAFELRKRLRDALQTELLPAFERAFEEIAPGDDVVHLPRLELHVRISGADDVSERLPDLIYREIGRQLSAAVKAGKSIPFADRDDTPVRMAMRSAERVRSSGAAGKLALVDPAGDPVRSTVQGGETTSDNGPAMHQGLDGEPARPSDSSGAPVRPASGLVPQAGGPGSPWEEQTAQHSRLQMLVSYLETGVLPWPLASLDRESVLSALRPAAIEQLARIAPRLPDRSGLVWRQVAFYFRLFQLVSEEKWAVVADSMAAMLPRQWHAALVEAVSELASGTGAPIARDARLQIVATAMAVYDTDPGGFVAGELAAILASALSESRAREAAEVTAQLPQAAAAFFRRWLGGPAVPVRVHDAPVRSGLVAGELVKPGRRTAEAGEEGIETPSSDERLPEGRPERVPDARASEPSEPRIEIPSWREGLSEARPERGPEAQVAQARPERGPEAQVAQARPERGPEAQVAQGRLERGPDTRASESGEEGIEASSSGGKLPEGRPERGPDTRVSEPGEPGIEAPSWRGRLPEARPERKPDVLGQSAFAREPELPVMPARGEGIEPFAMAVSHAGLILLHPFLPRLFETTRIREAGKANLAPARLPRAAALLHLLATGEEEAYEFELGFIKILLGLRIESHLPIAGGLLDSSDHEEAEALLAAVIGHWNVLKNTSVQGLRSSFLMRRGFVREDEQGFRLQMEPESFDMLLGHLPWGIGTVKLSWMNKPIFTDWPAL